MRSSLVVIPNPRPGLVCQVHNTPTRRELKLELDGIIVVLAGCLLLCTTTTIMQTCRTYPRIGEDMTSKVSGKRGQLGRFWRGSSSWIGSVGGKSTIRRNRVSASRVTVQRRSTSRFLISKRCVQSRFGSKILHSAPLTVPTRRLFLPC